MTRVGSDHAPIVVDDGEVAPPRQRYFFFEEQWLMEGGFKEKVDLTWSQIREKLTGNVYSMNRWHKGIVACRQWMRGLDIQRKGEQKESKMKLLNQLQKWDEESERRELKAEEWKSRYQIEEELEKIYAMEAIFWQQRSGNEWILKGGNNTKYFQLIANGRRRKSFSLGN